MIQKVIIGVLMLTVIGAAGVGVYDATRAPSVEPLPGETVQTDDTGAEILPGAEITATDVTLTSTEPTSASPTGEIVQRTQTQSHTGHTEITGDSTGPLQANTAAGMVGDPWAGEGTILDFDEVGFTLLLADGTEQYVELGPAMYWQALEVTLAAGDSVTISGFDNGQQIHAGIVRTATGQEMALRSAEGLPLWSGGAQSNGNNGAGEIQVAPDAWVTLAGTVSAMQGANLTVTTEAGETLSVQLGQPQFTAEQNITFAVGDSIEVLGFWEGAQFKAGEIRKPATGERLMLLDPNGRPLWGGPGRAGVSGQGASGQVGSAGQGQQAAGHGQQAAGQGNQGGGWGQQAASTRGAGVQNAVPSAEWQTLTGNVTSVEPLAISIQTSTGEQVRVGLGTVDFWAQQGYVFVVPESITVMGFWAGDVFEAGQLTFNDGTGTLYFRDAQGALLWGANGTGSQGQGQSQGTNSRQYRGGR
ncbi:MAG: hypothetical protein JXN59_12430 [Anaerolineae bacterium]|nr:hypothetical protein [Anaerolineae bacterium]